MKWEKTTLGQHCVITSSKRFHLSDRSEYGIPFYCSKEIIQKVKGQEVTDCDYIKEEAYEEVKNNFGVPQSGDLLITTRGTYGVPYLYKDTDCFYFADGNLTWLKEFDNELLPEFLYYWILSYEGQKKIDAIAKGTAQKAVPITLIKDIEIMLPPMNCQKKISAILFDYDHLIENNQKQIKLLEEAAQRLYKEWFVDLHFPGWKNTEIVDGVPKGWKKNKAENFFEVTIGKTPLRAEKQWFTDGNAGVKWVSISDMGDSSDYIFETKEGLTDEAIKKFNIKIAPKGTIFVSFKLTVGRVSIATEDMCTNEAIAHFHINNSILRNYTYLYLKSFEYDELGNTSSISKAINSKIIKAMPFVMPDDDLIEKFYKITEPMMKNIFDKQTMIIRLKEARDRLLLKLMSGELEV